MIKTINAEMFAGMIISGANNLSNNKKEVNELNVFPVPDGDTGTNMSLTAAAVAKSLSECRFADISAAANAAANAALRGARGNSGVIMSQLLRGMAKELKGKSECSANIFAACLKQGSDAAYRAVMNPTEGTLLTVAREAAAGAVLCGGDDILEILAAAVKRGNAALKKTMYMLETLKKAGVVDAGGQGWMYILEGMLYYLEKGRIIENSAKDNTGSAKTIPNSADLSQQNIKFGYCTEFIIEKRRECNILLFKNSIEKLGDCMLVIDGDDVIKVHIHTNHPGVIIENALKLGELINIKIDNMRHQHNSIINADENKNTADEKTAEKKKYGFAAVVPGEGFAEMLSDMGVDEIIKGGQTMNPSTEDILKAAESINAENIFIFPNNKNIIMAANQAADISDKNIIVIPSKTVPESISAMLEFDESLSGDKNEKNMTEALKNVKTVQVTYAVRDLEDTGIKKDDFIGMSTGTGGSEICKAGKDRYIVTKSLIQSIIEEDTELVTVYYGENEYKAEAERIASELESEFDDIEFSVKYGGQDVYYYIISAE